MGLADIVQKLDIKALPYVLFMIVPVLGRMSDPDDDVRATSTNTFAALVKMVPLEVAITPPRSPTSADISFRLDCRILPGSRKTCWLAGRPSACFSLNCWTARRSSSISCRSPSMPSYERTSKKVSTGLRSLPSTSCTAFSVMVCNSCSRGRRLHADRVSADMGLGKTLQSICILSGKHYERSERYKETQSPDSVHLPSLIVCPPTLTGHWYHEIQKYSQNLRPMLYVGNSRDRTRLVSKFSQFDVVITSYEVVRNDVAHLEKVFWHYCILDEGHIIKNAKTKLTKSVKQIRANHRVILSGTPIQNNVLELWSLFDFLMPGFLGTEQSFNDRFSKPILANRDGKAKNPEAGQFACVSLSIRALTDHLRSQLHWHWRPFISRSSPSSFAASRRMFCTTSRRRSSKITTAIYPTSRSRCTTSSPTLRLATLCSLKLHLRRARLRRASSTFSSRYSTCASWSTIPRWF
jgi:TATA-binding protein-associated factor